MTMELIQPTLEEMGHTLWGANWREHLSAGFETTEDEVKAWERDPTKRPADLEKQIDHLCVKRIQEIEIMRALLEETGLRGPTGGASN
jgi:hypothetical protein